MTEGRNLPETLEEIEKAIATSIAEEQALDEKRLAAEQAARETYRAATAEASAEYRVATEKWNAVLSPARKAEERARKGAEIAFKREVKPVRIATGALLWAARHQFAKGEWEKWCHEHVSLAPRTIREYLKLAKAADPEVALAEKRSKGAQRVRQHRERKRQKSGVTSAVTPAETKGEIVTLPAGVAAKAPLKVSETASAIVSPLTVLRHQCQAIKSEEKRIEYITSMWGEPDAANMRFVLSWLSLWRDRIDVAWLCQAHPCMVEMIANAFATPAETPTEAEQPEQAIPAPATELAEGSNGTTDDDGGLFLIYDGLKVNTQKRAEAWVKGGRPVASDPAEPIPITEALLPFRALAAKATEAQIAVFLRRAAT